jgi:hypothetical protein
MVEVSTAIQRFEHNLQAIHALVAGVDDRQARWKPAPDEWSILEVIHHLYDEEREDFRPRLDLTLHHPDLPWPPNDPVAKVAERRYNEQDLREILSAFQHERAASMAWLGTLHAPDWKRSHTLAQVGTLRAGDLLVSWLAHDILHLRQLAELHYHYITHLAQPYEVDYAGEW